jgi:DNA repair exonuclease SbcCD nuclease subunit
MKILFSADWHLKLGQKNVPKNWAINRYELLFKEIYKLEKQVDLHIIGGDLFDRLPNLDELSLYFQFIKNVTIPTIIYPGNHEALKKTTTFFSNLKEVTTAVNSNVTIIDDYYKIENMDFIPYNKLKEFNPKDFSGDILFTHVRGEIPPHVTPEIDLEKLDRWKIVIAGDLHSHENSQRNIVYPGSPVTTSFHRNPVDTGVLLFDNDTVNYSFMKLKLPQLIRQTVASTEQMKRTHYNHTIYELEGDLTELAKVDGDMELLDKKLVKRKSEAALILTKGMTIEEELSEYLQYILGLNDKKTKEVIGVFNDYT